MSGLLVCGACGRMGRLIADEAPEYGFTVVAGVDPLDAASGEFPLYASFADCDRHPDVIVDFSAPSSLSELLAFAVEKGIPSVLGATGYSEEDRIRMRAASESVPLFYSPNMSMGVFALKKLTALAAGLLPGFDIEIVEKHHRMKVDAPSGTALALFHALPGSESLQALCGREGRQAQRHHGEVGLHAVRGGTLAGEHEIGFYGNGETLLLSHHAQGREVFVSGALKAAAWLLGQAPGFYGMEDLMAFSDLSRRTE